MDSKRDGQELPFMEIRAEALWAGTRSAVPVLGRAWFVASEEALARCGKDLAELVQLARVAYPTMHSAVDRMALESKYHPKLKLRSLELCEDDLGGAGLGSVRKALEKRAQVCGMRIVASLNAVAGMVVAHGMPLDRPPGAGGAADKALTLIEEIELIDSSASELEIDARSERGRL